MKVHEERITLHDNVSFLSLHLTLGCNARCRHCVFESGPDKKHLTLTPQEVIVAVRTAREHGVLIMGLTGGEPFLVLDLVELALKEAAEVGLPYSYIVTNAFWATSPAKAMTILSRLAKLGLRRIQVSYDRYHAEFVPVNRVINACQQARELDFVVQVSTTEANDSIKQQTLDALGPAAEFALGPDISSFNLQPPIPIGRGALLSDAELQADQPVQPECLHFKQHLPFLSVFPGRLVSFCGYANPRLTYRYPFKRDWLSNMLRVWNKDRCVRDLWTHGLMGLIPEAITGLACGHCFKWLPVLYPDKELIDVRGIGKT